MTELAVTLVCGGCGWQAADDDPFPFTCGGARPGDDTDHVLVRTLDASRVTFPNDAHPNPFVAYRTLIRSYHLARAHGMQDDEYVRLVRDADDAVARVDGKGFLRTPLRRYNELDRRLGFRSGGGVWVKDETPNVSGSHKGRHLMGVLLHLKVVERLGLGGREAPRLAIASCGNAALAAAVIAAAGGLSLLVFVPEDAESSVMTRLRELGAQISVCPREAGVPGDPTVARLSQAIADGALPFTCQGNRNGLAVEGGHTLGWEMAATLAEEQMRPDRLFVQVGGGALAGACAGSLAEARALGVLASEPALHVVQTRGAFPLPRAFRALQERGGASALAYAATHRSEFMWPWEQPPASAADGILDDETYDWLAVVRRMFETGGDAHVVDEELLMEANDLAFETTGIEVDPTGSAGLAGLLAARASGGVDPDETVLVIFTGVRRPGLALA